MTWFLTGAMEKSPKVDRTVPEKYHTSQGLADQREEGVEEEEELAERPKYQPDRDKDKTSTIASLMENYVTIDNRYGNDRISRIYR